MANASSLPDLPAGQLLYRLLVYGNVWIALGAVGHGLQSQLLLAGYVLSWPYLLFLFGGTLAHYGLHRMISLYRHGEPVETRFRIISRLQRPIVMLLLSGGLAATACLFYFTTGTLLFLLLPVGLSLWYVLPGWKGKRLRDWPYVKIFVIALSWSWLTAWGWAWEAGMERQASLLLQFFERFLFLFAITLPFDIRDLDLDRELPVATLAWKLGLTGSRLLALLSLGGSIAFAGLQIHWGWYPLPAFWGMLPSWLIAGGLILGSRPDRPDSYYSFWLDGTLLLQGAGTMLALWIAGWTG